MDGEHTWVPDAMRPRAPARYIWIGVDGRPRLGRRRGLQYDFSGPEGRRRRKDGAHLVRLPEDICRELHDIDRHWSEGVLTAEDRRDWRLYTEQRIMTWSDGGET